MNPSTEQKPFVCPFCDEKHAPFGKHCKNRLMDVAKDLQKKGKAHLKNQEGKQCQELDS